MVFLDPICCSISPHCPRSPRSAPSFNPNSSSTPVPASHPRLLLSETRDAPNTVVFDSIKFVAKQWGWGFPPAGPLLASLWVAINERPFDLAKVALYLVRFPNLSFYVIQPFLPFPPNLQSCVHDSPDLAACLFRCHHSLSIAPFID